MRPHPHAPDSCAIPIPFVNIMRNLINVFQTRFFNHHAAPTPQATNRAGFPVSFTRAPMPPPVQSPDFQALLASYDSLTGGAYQPVHFPCNGNNATIMKALGNQFIIRGRVTSQPFDPYAKEDTVNMSPAGVSGRNGNTGQPLGPAEQQNLIQTAKFALGHGIVRSTPFPPDVLFNGI